MKLKGFTIYPFLLVMLMASPLEAKGSVKDNSRAMKSEKLNKMIEKMEKYDKAANILGKRYGVDLSRNPIGKNGEIYDGADGNYWALLVRTNGNVLNGEQLLVFLNNDLSEKSSMRIKEYRRKGKDKKGEYFQGEYIHGYFIGNKSKTIAIVKKKYRQYAGEVTAHYSDVDLSIYDSSGTIILKRKDDGCLNYIFVSPNGKMYAALYKDFSGEHDECNESTLEFHSMSSGYLGNNKIIRRYSIGDVNLFGDGDSDCNNAYEQMISILIQNNILDSNKDSEIVGNK